MTSPIMATYLVHRTISNIQQSSILNLGEPRCLNLLLEDLIVAFGKWSCWSRCETGELIDRQKHCNSLVGTHPA